MTTTYTTRPAVQNGVEGHIATRWINGLFFGGRRFGITQQAAIAAFKN